MRKNFKKISAMVMAICLGMGLLTGCGAEEKKKADTKQEADTGKKTFVFGDTTFNPENEEPDINPHNMYSGWACIRY